MKVGQVNTLKILRFTSVGAYLGDEKGNDVLFPNKYLTPELQEDQDIEVFLYRDSEDRLVATSETPYIALNDFALLEAKDVSLYGAFMDWGLEKDLMIPFKEQKNRLEIGRKYLCTLRYDDATDRLYGSVKLNKFLVDCEDTSIEGRPCECIAWEYTDLGLKVIVNGSFKGLIYRNDLSRPLKPGEQLKGYVQTVRPDGKLDISLHPIGVEKFDEATTLLVEKLKQEKVIYLSDKSDPDEIREQVAMSKKLFKQTIGKLYKKQLISIHEDRIEWLSKD